MKTKRSSNLELLRILAMLMIISYHIYRYSVRVQLTDLTSIELMENGVFTNPVYDSKLLLPAVAAPMGMIGNAVFVLISGYFMAEKQSINLKRISVKLLTQQLFAAVVLTIASTVVWTKLPEEFITLLSFQSFNTMTWFVGYYFIIMVCAALFLNQFLNSLKKEGYVTFLVVLFALTQFTFPVRILNNLADNLDRVFVGVFLYALGGAIRRYDLFGRVNVLCLLLMMAAAWGLIVLSTYNQINLSIEKYLITDGSKLFVPTMPDYANRNLTCIVIGVVLFELFRRINIGKWTLINYLGSSTLMVYLIHDNEFVHDLFNIQDWATLLYNDPNAYAKTMTRLVFITFGVGVAAYTVYAILAAVIGGISRLGRGKNPNP